MSLEWMDGFDHYNANTARKWDSTSTGSLSQTTGRFSGKAGTVNTTPDLILTAAAPASLANKQTRVIGFACKILSISGGTDIVRFKDTTTNQAVLAFNGSRQFDVKRNTTVLATSSYIAPVGVWIYVEFKAVIADAGSYEVRVNGVNVLSGSADTQQSANAYSNGLEICGGSVNNWDIDDMYMLNTDGSSPFNDFLGEVRITTQTASGAGNSTQWTPSAGSNYQNVDDTIESPDDDTTYNSSTTAGNKDTYAITDFTVGGSVLAVQTNLLVRKDDAGSATIKEVCRSGGTDFEATATFQPASTYLYHHEIRITDPNTGVAWTTSGLNSAEFGIKQET